MGSYAYTKQFRYLNSISFNKKLRQETCTDKHVVLAHMHSFVQTETQTLLLLHWKSNGKRDLNIKFWNTAHLFICFECTGTGAVPGALGSDCSSSKCSPGGADAGDPLKDEPGDFIETNCHWRECGLEFPTQDDLVKVIL